VSGELIVLQSRPITTLAPAAATDKRAWYRSLSRMALYVARNIKRLMLRPTLCCVGAAHVDRAAMRSALMLFYAT